MARARRRRPRQTGNGGGLPGWAMLTIGLIIGLFVAFLVYLDDIEEPPSAAVQSTGDANSPDPSVSDSSAENQQDDSDGPRFEFYSILPELEVVVPDEPTDKPRSQSDDLGTQGADGSTDESSPTRGDGTFYLQAGSFQKADQADRMKAQIALIGLDVEIQTVNVNGQRWHRVRVGPYARQSTLRAAQQRLRDNDIDFLILREKTSG